MLLFVLLSGSYCITEASGNSNNGERSSREHQNANHNDVQVERSLSGMTMMMPGDRVSALDRKNVICSADFNPDPEMVMGKTVIDYYYAIESSEPITTADSTGKKVIGSLESLLFKLINPTVLWCYFDQSIFTRSLLSRGSHNLDSDDSSSLPGTY